MCFFQIMGVVREGRVMKKKRKILLLRGKENNRREEEDGGGAVGGKERDERGVFQMRVEKEETKATKVVGGGNYSVSHRTLMMLMAM